MSAQPSSAQFAKRDDLLLQHAALYRVLLPHIVWAAYFAGKQAGHVLKRLADQGLLQAFPRALPGGLTYYLLTLTGCLSARAPKERAEPFQGAAFELAIGVSTFCFLGRARRYRLEPAEVDALLASAQPTNVPFVVTDEGGAPCVLRIVQGATASPQQLVKQVAELADKLSRDHDLHHRLVNGELGFGVLTPTPQKRRAVEQALAASSLGRELMVIVDLGATAETLATLVKRKEGT